MNLILVICLCPKDYAEQIALSVIQKRLAACADIIPANWGIVGWEPEYIRTNEVQILITTEDELVNDLYNTIITLHPSARPVVVNLEITETYSPYLEWLETALGGNK
jgi:periplasmic divalent cation tolerance protein